MFPRFFRWGSGDAGRHRAPDEHKSGELTLEVHAHVSPCFWNESPVANLRTRASRRLTRGDDPTKEAI